jgi:hypothetical protein
MMGKKKAIGKGFSLMQEHSRSNVQQYFIERTRKRRLREVHLQNIAGRHPRFSGDLNINSVAYVSLA